MQIKIDSHDSQEEVVTVIQSSHSQSKLELLFEKINLVCDFWSNRPIESIIGNPYLFPKAIVSNQSKITFI